MTKLSECTGINMTQPQNLQQNPDGTWSEAVPLPFYGIRKKCSCGKKFWREENYVRHYKKHHTTGILYKHTPTGMVVVGRRYYQ